MHLPSIFAFTLCLRASYPNFFLWAENSLPVARALSPAGKRSSTMVEPIAFSDMYVRRVNGSKAKPMNQATPAK